MTVSAQPFDLQRDKVRPYHDVGRLLRCEHHNLLFILYFFGVNLRENTT